MKVQNNKEKMVGNEKQQVEITPELIQEWKKQHGKIYKSTIDGEEFYWRRLKRKEYVTVMSDEALEEEQSETRSRIYHRQEEIVKIAVLYPVDIEKHIADSAGLATSLADEIILRSGFDIPKTEEL